MTPKVTVVVAVRNEAATIKSCLTSILANSQTEVPYEVIVVDGDSHDNTMGIVREFPVRILQNPKCTASSGRNMGVSGSCSPYVAFTDGDCEVGRDWLSVLVNEIESSTARVAGVGGSLLIPGNASHFSRAVGVAQNTLIGSGGSIQSYVFEKEREVESISNSNAIYRREVIVDVGGFDEDLRIGQDADLNHRIRSGTNLSFRYTPKAVVYHHRRPTLRRFCIQTFGYGRAMAILLDKHRGLTRWFSPLPLAAVLAVAIIGLVSLAYESLFILESALLLTYLAVLVGAIAEAGVKSRTILSVMCVVILPVQHLAYALGYGCGLISILKTRIRLRRRR